MLTQYCFMCSSLSSLFHLIIITPLFKSRVILYGPHFNPWDVGRGIIIFPPKAFTDFPPELSVVIPRNIIILSWHSITVPWGLPLYTRLIFWLFPLHFLFSLPLSPLVPFQNATQLQSYYLRFLDWKCLKQRGPLHRRLWIVKKK